MVDRRAGLKRDSGRELTSYCIGFGNSARGQHWEDIRVGLSMDTLSSRPQVQDVQELKWETLTAANHSDA